MGNSRLWGLLLLCMSQEVELGWWVAAMTRQEETDYSGMDLDTGDQL